jgi:prevent-host-death family protein
MMAEVGAHEARTNFAALLKRVEQGERITITKHGRAVAVLAPAPGAADRTAGQAIDEILEFRSGRRLGPGVSIRQLIDEGRR